HHQRRGGEGDAGPGVQPAADGQAAEDQGHPPEDRRPDRHAGQAGDDEEDRHRPVDHPRRQFVPDDLVADHDVLAIASDVDRGGTGSADLAHDSPPVSFGFFGPKAMKWPIAPNTAPAIATKPTQRMARFQTLATTGTPGSFGSPYHSG